MLTNEYLLVEAVPGLDSSPDVLLVDIVLESPNGDEGWPFSSSLRNGDRLDSASSAIAFSRAIASAASFSISAIGGSGGSVLRKP